MGKEHEKKLDARYRNQFGYVAGYLPKDRAGVDEWLRSLRRNIDEAAQQGRKPPHSDAVEELGALIRLNGIVRMYVEQMIAQQPSDEKLVDSVPGLLQALHRIVTTAPVYNSDPSKINAFPMSSLFTYMMMTPAGKALFRNTEFNDAIRKVLKEWCAFLDSPASAKVLNEQDEGWLSQSAYWYNRLFEFQYDKRKPHWGWKSFNDYFHRQIKPESRPVAEPDNPKVIVSANDGTVFNIGTNARPTTDFWLKGERYSLVNMLGTQDVGRFVGGSVFQSFLSGANYHRWRSPVDGTVRQARVVNGLMFSDAESAGFDDTAATYSQFYETAVNTRGLVFIESPDPNIGMVCVIPIGITEISSVKINVKEGQKLRRAMNWAGSAMAARPWRWCSSPARSTSSPCPTAPPATIPTTVRRSGSTRRSPSPDNMRPKGLPLFVGRTKLRP